MHGETGLLVDGTDVERVAEAIGDVLEDPAPTRRGSGRPAAPGSSVSTRGRWWPPDSRGCASPSAADPNLPVTEGPTVRWPRGGGGSLPQLPRARERGRRVVRSVLTSPAPRTPNRSRRRRCRQRRPRASRARRRGRARPAAPTTRSSSTCAVERRSRSSCARRRASDRLAARRALWSLTFPGVGHAKIDARPTGSPAAPVRPHVRARPRDRALRRQHAAGLRGRRTAAPLGDGALSGIRGRGVPDRRGRIPFVSARTLLWATVALIMVAVSLLARPWSRSTRS